MFRPDHEREQYAARLVIYDDTDANGNEHRYRGVYQQRLTQRGRVRIVTHAVHDVFFRVRR